MSQSRQIIETDYLTSQQMAGRPRTEKEAVSPRDRYTGQFDLLKFFSFLKIFRFCCKVTWVVLRWKVSGGLFHPEIPVL